MDLIGAILAGIAAVIMAAFSKQVSDEFKAWTPRLIAAVIQCATRMLREDQRDRYAEEWRSHIDETPGEIGKLLVGLGLLSAAWKLSRVSPNPTADEIVSVLRAAIRWVRLFKEIPSETGKLIFYRRTRRTQKRFDILDVPLDQQMLSDMEDVIQRIAIEEPDDQIMQEIVARGEKAWAQGFEKSYQRHADQSGLAAALAAALAEERARRRSAAAGPSKPRRSCRIRV